MADNPSRPAWSHLARRVAAAKLTSDTWGEGAMSDVRIRLAAGRAAVEELMISATDCGDRWHVPRAAGKWSPSQIVEHVARCLEESAKDMFGQPSKLPQLPRPVRFLARSLIFKRVMRIGRVPKAKTIRRMDPESGPETPSHGRARLDRAWHAFEEAAIRRSQHGEGASSRILGSVALSDYVRYQELHVRHHRDQMPDH